MNTELTLDQKLKNKFEELERPFSVQVSLDKADFDKIQSAFYYDFFGIKNLGLQSIGLNCVDFILVHFPGEFESSPLYFPQNNKVQFLKMATNLVLRQNLKISSTKLYEDVIKLLFSNYNLLAHEPELRGGSFDLFGSGYMDKRIKPNSYKDFIEYDEWLRQNYEDDFHGINWLSQVPLKERDRLDSLKETADKDIQGFYDKINSNIYLNFIEFVKENFGDLVTWNAQGNELFFIIKGDRKALLQHEVVKALISRKGKAKIEELSFYLGLKTLPDQLTKPITKKELRELFSQNFIFDFDKETDSVSFWDMEVMAEKLGSIIKKSEIPFALCTEEITKTGIMALVFKGQDYPLEEAVEYIRVRPILYLEHVSEKTSLSKILTLGEELTGSEKSDIKYLKCMFSSNEEYKNWLDKNTAVSFIKLDKNLSQHIYPHLVSELSPIFNLNHNPGNLLQYTITSKLEDALSKRNNRVAENSNE